MKNLITIFICLFFCCSIYAQKKELPSEERLMQINDSIVEEGEALYVSEIMSWRLTDLYFSRQHKAEDIGGSLVYDLSESVCSALFVNKERDNCLFEIRMDLTSGEMDVIDSVRPITERENEELLDRLTKIGIAIKQYADSLNWISQEEGRFNWDLLHIDGHHRLYVLQGVTKSDVIPFGNDYSFDFNENNEIINFRKYHKSFLPLPTVTENGEIPEETVHSHLRDNPFITATDICNFLLYGMPAGMKSFSVLSTYYQCCFRFSSSENKITVVKF